MAVYSFTIGGVTAKLQPGWTITEMANGRTSLRGSVVSVNASVRPAIGQEVLFRDISDEEDPVILFGGTIESPEEAGVGGWGLIPIETRIVAVDFNALAARRYVTLTIPAGTLKAALTALLAHLASTGGAMGITLHGSQVDGPSLPELPYLSRRVDDVLSELSVISNGYTWNIDAGKVLRMATPDTTAAPFNLSAGDGRAIGDVTVEPSRQDYANRVIVLFGQGLQIVTDTFVGDGVETVFTLRYTLASAHTGYVTNGGVNEPMGVTTPPYWVHDPVTGTITRSSAPAAASAISITYTALFPGRVSADDSGGIAALGLWEKILTQPEVFDIDVAQALATAYVARTVLQPRVVKYRTFQLGIHPGQSQTITLPLRNLSGSFVITDVVTTGTSANLVERRVTALEGSLLTETWRDTFKSWGGTVSGGGVTLVTGGGGTGSGALGTGTIGTLAKWTATDTLGDSLVTQAGSVVSVAGLADVVGVASAGFTTGIRTGNWDALGFVTAGNTLALGGFRASQWVDVKVYASGALAGTFASAGLTVPGTVTAAGFSGPGTGLSNVALLDAANTFSNVGVQSVAGIVNVTGVLNSSINTSYRMATWDMLGWDAGNWVTFGGFRATQWLGVKIYASTALMVTITTTGLGVGATPADVLHIASSSNAYIRTDSRVGGGAASASGWAAYDNSVRRWELLNSTTNDIKLNRYNSSGVFQDQPLTVSGSTGVVTILNQLDRSGGLTFLAGSANIHGISIDASGNAIALVNLSSVGDFAVNTNKFTVTAASGNAIVAGTLAVAGNFAVNTNKFTVAASTGNTLVAGDFSVNALLTVAGATGNADIQGYVGHPSYVSQTSKWRVTNLGEADFRYLFADEMHVKVFIADLEQALAGGQIITKSVAMVGTAFTVPSAGGTATLWVRDLPSAANMAAFESGDYVTVRTFSRASGTLTVADAVGVVTAYADGTGGNAGLQSWTFTRASGGSAGTMTGGTVIAVDSLVLDYGVSGNGYYEVNAIDGVYGINSPYAQIVTWTTAPVSANKVLRARFGNLRGITGTTGEYGMIAGTYAATNGQYFRASSSAVELHGVDFSMWDGTTNVFAVRRNAHGANLSPYISIGSPAPTMYGQVGVWMGWLSLFDTATVRAAFSCYTNAGNYLIYDGVKLTWSAANTTLDASGNLTATSATLSGAITATSGVISGALTVSGSIASVATDFGTGNGLWIDNNGGFPRFRIGIIGGNLMSFDGTNLTLTTPTVNIGTNGLALDPAAVVVGPGDQYSDTNISSAYSWVVSNGQLGIGGLDTVSPRTRTMSLTGAWSGAGDCLTSLTLIASHSPSSGGTASEGAIFVQAQNSGSLIKLFATNIELVGTATLNGSPIDTGSGAAAAGTLTGTTLAANVVASSLTSVGTITSGTWSGSFGAVSGANLTNLAAGNITGNLAYARLPTGAGTWTGTPTISATLNTTGVLTSGLVTNYLAATWDALGYNNADNYLVFGGFRASQWVGVRIYASNVIALTLTSTTAVFPGTVTGTSFIGSIAAASLTGTTMASNVVTSSLTSVGTITSGTWSALFGAVSGANLTSLTAANLLGTITSAVQDNITRTGTLVSGSTGAGYTIQLSVSTITGNLAYARMPSGSGTWTAVPTISGAVVLQSTLAVTGDIAVNTNKFTVAASTGNTVVAGTLVVTGNTDASGYIGHPSYASQTTNWRITAAGEADFRYLFADQMHVKTFIADLEQALAGGQIISKSVAVIAVAFTVPAASGTATLWVRDLPSAANMAAFQTGDSVVVRSFSRASGSLTVSDAVGVVTAYADGTGGNAGWQSWTFTRNAGGNAGSMTGGTVIEVDSLVLDYGTTGNGYYEVSAIDGVYGIDSPYAQVVTWATSPVAANKTLRARFGNLRGVTGNTGEYGLIAGTYAATNGQYFRASSSAFELHGIDLSMWDGTTNVFAVRRNSLSPYLSLGNPAPSAYGANAGVFIGWNHATLKAQASFYADANNYLQYDGANLTWKGANTSLNASGNLTATSATLSGAITATSGSISGAFTIGNGGSLASGATAFGTGNGYWLSLSGSTTSFRIGTIGGNLMSFDGTNLTLTTPTVNIGTNGLALDPAAVVVGPGDQYSDTNISSAYSWVVSNGQLGIGGLDTVSPRTRTMSLTGAWSGAGDCLTSLTLIASHAPSSGGTASEGAIFVQAQNSGSLVKLVATNIELVGTATLNGSPIDTGSGAAAAGTLTGTTLAANVVASSLTSVGTITSGTWSGSFGAVSGANLTNLAAANLTGNLAYARLPTGAGTWTGTPTISATINVTGVLASGLLTGYMLATWDALGYNNADNYIVLGGFRASQWVGVRIYASNVIAQTLTSTTVVFPGTVTGTSFIGNIAAASLTGTTMASNVVTSSLTTVGTIASGTWSALFGAVSGANLISLTAANLLGTITSSVQDNITRTGTLVSGSTGAGYTIQLSVSTITGNLAYARMPSGSGTWTAGPTISGAVVLQSTLDVTGNLAVNTNKFTVAASSGNTLVAGTLAITGNTDSQGYIGHPSYASQTTNWRVTAAGEADFRYMFVDQMHAKTFIADLEQALAGGQIISKSVAMVSQAFTVPAASGTATLWVRDLPSAANMAAFQTGDSVVLRSFSRASGSLTITDAVGVVTSYTDGTGGNAGQQSWTFTRGAGGSAGTMTGGTVIEVDSLVLDYGTTGNGYYEVNAIDGVYGVDSPYAQVVTWVTAPVAANKTLRARFGNLRGVTGNTGEYGLIAGTYAATNGQYFRASSSAFELHGIDLSMWDGTTNVFAVRRNSLSPYLSLGNPAPSSYGANAGVFIGWNHATLKAQASFYADANNYLQYDGANLTWKGANTSLNASGNLTATSATLSGAITATSGSISGAFTIGNGGSLASGATAFGTGNGYWLSLSGSTTSFRIGTIGGNLMSFDGTNLTLTTPTVNIGTNGLALDPAAVVVGPGDQYSDTNVSSAYSWVVSSGRLGIAGLDTSSPRTRTMSLSAEWSGAGDCVTSIGMSANYSPSSGGTASEGSISVQAQNPSSLIVITATNIQLVGNATLNGSPIDTGSGAAAAGTLTGTTLAANVVASSLTSVGTITSGTWSGSFGAVSGANLTSLTAGNLSGTITSAVQDNITRTGTLVSGQTGAGYTIQLSVSTLSGNLPYARMPTGAGTWTGTPTISATLNTTGVLTSGLLTNYLMATWDALGYNNADNYMVLGGFRAAQWVGVRIYASNVIALTLTSTTAVFPGTVTGTSFIGNIAAASLTGTTIASNVVSSSLTLVGTVTSGTWSALFGAVSGANLTSLTAANLLGTITSAVQDNITRTGTLVSGQTGAGYTIQLSVSTLTGNLPYARMPSGSGTWTAVPTISGAVVLQSTLAVTGDVSVNTNKFTVTAVSGNTLVAGTLAVTSDLAINTNKFTVAASSGNTVVAGTLAIAGNTDASGYIGHPSFASQTTNWRITAAGEADFRYMFVDQMHAKTFIADLEQALAGGQIISKSVAMVAQAFTVPAASGTATLWVRDLPSAANMAAFQTGDSVVLRSFSRATGSLTITDAVGVVTSYTDGTGGNAGQQSWTFTRGAGASAGNMPNGTVIEVDSLVIDYGTTGNGFYEVNAIDGVYGVDSPYAQVVTWATSPIAANKTLRARFGNLRGITGNTGEYGLIAGTYAATNGQYFRASSSAFELHGIDLSMWDGTTNVFAVRRNSLSPYLSLGNPAPSAYGANAGVFLGWSHASLKAQLSLYADANNYLQYDGANLTWKGANTSLNSSGNLTATSATLSGAITATSGSISGAFTIGNGGSLASGATAFATGLGYWLSLSGTTTSFRVGDPTGNRMSWDGANLTLVTPTVNIGTAGISLDFATTVNNGESLTPAEVSYAYSWGVTNGMLGLIGSDTVSPRTRTMAQVAQWSGTGDCLLSFGLNALYSPVMTVGITRSGTVATATTSIPHRRLSGETVNISGAVQSSYNGDKVVTVTSPTVFTFTVSGSPATPATGTIVMDGGIIDQATLSLVASDGVSQSLLSATDLVLCRSRNISLEATSSISLMAAVNIQGGAAITSSNNIAQLALNNSFSVSQFIDSGAGTAPIFLEVANASGDAYFGLEGSGAGTLATGSIAYAALVGPPISKALQFITTGSVRQTIFSGGGISNDATDPGAGKHRISGGVFPTGSVCPRITGASGGNFLELVSTGTGATSWVEYLDTSSNWILFNSADRLKVSAAGIVTIGSNLIVGGTGTITGGFGCNTKSAQAAYASGGPLSAYATGAFGLNSDANMGFLYALVVNMRAALVANGIMS